MHLHQPAVKSFALITAAVLSCVGFPEHSKASDETAFVSVAHQLYPNIELINPQVVATSYQSLPKPDNFTVSSPQAGAAIVTVHGDLSPLVFFEVNVTASLPQETAGFEPMSTSFLIGIVSRLGERFDVSLKLLATNQQILKLAVTFGTT
mgnify:CR=1 FL=1